MNKQFKYIKQFLGNNLSQIGIVIGKYFLDDLHGSIMQTLKFTQNTF